MRATGQPRDALLARLKEAGIPTAIHYPTPIDAQPAYVQFSVAGATPASAEAAQAVFSVPMSADLSEADQERVARVLLGG